MIFLIFGMCMFYHFLAMESLRLGQCILLLLLFLIYFAVICYQQWMIVQPAAELPSLAD